MLASAKDRALAQFSTACRATDTCVDAWLNADLIIALMGRSGMETVMTRSIGAVILVQAESDATLLRLWLHGRSTATTSAYRGDANAFLAYVGKPIAMVRLGELQDYADTLKHLASASQARTLATVKSLFGFAHRLGYVPFNVAAALRLPQVRQQLAARIMTEADTHRLIALEPDQRNRTLLTLLYGAGLRATEAAELRWRDLHERDDAAR